ncbi:hypothetical protein AFK68_22345 [Hydrocoleum sp. CS-953]|nr:hypothetical protein AFK68_22345 [Hydrocoleum sp. CS-953]
MYREGKEEGRRKKEEGKTLLMVALSPTFTRSDTNGHDIILLRKEGRGQLCWRQKGFFQL